MEELKKYARTNIHKPVLSNSSYFIKIIWTYPAPNFTKLFGFFSNNKGQALILKTHSHGLYSVCLRRS